ncbi:MAG: sigma-70 family RNA polymerase sigma factor [Lachnospiraceae bacterium]|nr:sigma-70 family RNA polymerase sigma factor [Lachnospiraceae bacterium]
MYNELIKRAKRKDKQAFSFLFEQNLPDMYKVAKAILKKDEDVEDALQETALICWQKIGQLEKNRYFKTWMIRILINECNTILRKRKMVCKDEKIQERGTEDYGYLSVEWNLFLNTLEEKQRLVVILYYAQGYKVREIARIMETSESSVKKYLMKARNKVEELYKEEG